MDKSNNMVPAGEEDEFLHVAEAEDESIAYLFDIPQSNLPEAPDVFSLTSLNDNTNTPEQPIGGTNQVEPEADHFSDMVKAASSLTRPYEQWSFLDDKSERHDMKKEAIMRKNTNGLTSLMVAIRNRADIRIIRRMLELGKEDLIKIKNKWNENALHYAAYVSSPLDVFKAILECDGGKNLLIEKEQHGNTPLHLACRWYKSEEVITHLVKVGGKRALLQTNNKGQMPHLRKNANRSLYTLLRDLGGIEYETNLNDHNNSSQLSFHELIYSNELGEAMRRLKDPTWIQSKSDELYEKDERSHASTLMLAMWFYENGSEMFKPDLLSLIHLMIEVGGLKLAEIRDNKQSTCLHYAAWHKTPLCVVKRIIRVTGSKYISLQNNEWQNTPLHDACFREAPLEVIVYLIKKQKAMEAVLATNIEGQTPLDMLFDADHPSDDRIVAFQDAYYAHGKTVSKSMSKVLMDKNLKWASKQDPSHIASNKFIKSLLDQLFAQPKYLMVAFADLYAQVAQIVVFCLLLQEWTSTTGQRGNRFLYIVHLIGWIWLFVRELAQVISTRIDEYFVHYINYLQLSQLVLLIWSSNLLFKIEPKHMDDWDCTILISTIAISWVALIFVIGKLQAKVSIFTSVLVEIFVELGPFLVTSLFIIVAFSQMFFIASSGKSTCKDEWQCDVKSAFLQSSFMLFTTEFPFLDWKHDNTADWQQQVVSILFAFVVGILLLNILIGVVSNVFEKVSESSENAFWKMRLEFLLDINTFSTRFESLIMCLTKAKPISSCRLSASTSPASTSPPIYNNVQLPTSLQGSQQTFMSSGGDLPFTTTINRRRFAEYDDAWMKYRSHYTDDQDFFKWWYYSWKEYPDNTPSLPTRLKYFYKYASFREILLPGHVFQNILLGQKYNRCPSKHKKQVYFILASVLSYFHFIGMVALFLLIFVAGLCSFGLLWPQELKVYLVTGPKQSKDNSKHPQIDGRCQCHMLKNKVEKLEIQNEEMKRYMKDTKEDCSQILSRLNQILEEKQLSSLIPSDYVVV